MDKFRMIKRPQSNEGVKIEYIVSKNYVLKAEIFRWGEEEKEFQSDKILYYDLASLSPDSHYLGKYPISSVATTDTQVDIEVINAVGNEWSEDEANPEWLDVEFEDFEIPEDAEIIQLEGFVIPEPEPSPVDKLRAENKELSSKVEDLKRQLEFSDMTNQSMMFEMFEYISML